jgi:predicted nucleic acid-binding protein
MAAREPSREAMSECAVFDTSVLIDHLRTNCYALRMANLDLPVRSCSVTLAELWRGANSPTDRKIVAALERSRPILTPTQNNWLRSGKILAEIRDRHGFEPHKLRNLHFDVLIALTARAYGALLITSNRADFELIRRYTDFKLEVW